MGTSIPNAIRILTGELAGLLVCLAVLMLSDGSLEPVSEALMSSLDGLSLLSVVSCTWVLV